MARGKKGRKLSGWLIVDKPAGLGSTDVVNKVKWLLKAGAICFGVSMALDTSIWPVAAAESSIAVRGRPVSRTAAPAIA